MSPCRCRKSARWITFSPEFQSLVTDKGAMVLHMLRWVIGDEAFDKTMRTFIAQYAGKSATVDDFRKVAEQASGQSAYLVLHPVARLNRRTRIQEQVHRLSHAKGLPRGGRDCSRTWICSACRWS